MLGSYQLMLSIYTTSDVTERFSVEGVEQGQNPYWAEEKGPINKSSLSELSLTMEWQRGS